MVVDEEPAENLVALTKESLLNLLYHCSFRININHFDLHRYKKPFQGGTIISTANDEEWVFSSNGVLTNKAWGDALEYPRHCVLYYSLLSLTIQDTFGMVQLYNLPLAHRCLWALESGMGCG